MTRNSQISSNLKLENASVEKVERFLLETFGPILRVSATSNTDISELGLPIQSRSMPVWRVQLYNIYQNLPSSEKTIRARLYESIQIAVERDVNIPMMLAEAEASSDDPAFKTEEIRLYEYIARSKYPDIDPTQPYPIHAIFLMMQEGRFDVAAQIYHSADMAKKTRWNEILRYSLPD